MRLFIAVNFEPAVNQKLAALREAHRAVYHKADYSRDENLHLTLAFLGEVSDERAQDVINAMETLRFAPMKIEMHGEEKLGDGLLCLSVYRTPELTGTQSELCAALRDKGFCLEARDFRPHVTLARRFFGKAELDAHIKTVVSRITLFKSEPIGGKHVYTALHTVKAQFETQ
ncbi:MAG: RNA 2',3'-cyclic phosphodiesterase [Clostridia bacterium]|nr:RNA 2',3'-cyclic phosphodiesterase [Clostridia bacterium]